MLPFMVNKDVYIEGKPAESEAQSVEWKTKMAWNYVEKCFELTTKTTYRRDIAGGMAQQQILYLRTENSR